MATMTWNRIDGMTMDEAHAILSGRKTVDREAREMALRTAVVPAAIREHERLVEINGDLAELAADDPDWTASACRRVVENVAHFAGGLPLATRSLAYQLASEVFAEPLT